MIQEAGMPHIAFEIKAEAYVDVDGHTLYRDKYYVVITPRGAKDQVYKVADEWIDELKTKSLDRSGFDQNAAMYSQWHERVKTLFALFKEGHELPLYGTPLTTCMAFSPSEVAICKMVKIFTLEELAEANEEALNVMGMGARLMKLKAQKTMENTITGKVAEENAALRLRLEQLEQRFEQIGREVPAEKKRGRPRKVDDQAEVDAA